MIQQICQLEVPWYFAAAGPLDLGQKQVAKVCGQDRRRDFSTARVAGCSVYQPALILPIPRVVWIFKAGLPPRAPSLTWVQDRSAQI
jgi:hypothetical protein